MSVADAAAATIHLLSAGLWTGSVLFVAYAVLPLAVAGDLRVTSFRPLVGKLTTVSRVSALALFASGGHMAGNGYTVDSLFGSSRGHLVLTMVLLWFVLAALVEVGSAKLRDGLDAGKVRSPARDARRTFHAAAVVAVALLVVAGFLAGGLPF